MGREAVVAVRALLVFLAALILLPAVAAVPSTVGGSDRRSSLRSEELSHVCSPRLRLRLTTLWDPPTVTGAGEGFSSSAPAKPALEPRFTSSERDWLTASRCVPVASFAGDEPGGFPRGWRVRREDGYAVYRVMEEGGLRFLRAIARSVGTQAAFEHPWDLKERPIFTWRWRPRVFPAGSDERGATTNDSAVGVYVGFSRGPVAVRSIKYVWSRIASMGTIATASAGFTRMLVIRSGAADPNRWVEERVNVIEDHRRLFGTDPDTPVGIGVLTDSDDTRSAAEGDYAGFGLCRP
ncbi:MAG TPA: DUF3047 domain-containing protein [Candidatus Limnocylindrales bacterium]|nr:DUF3047 domain-containing protein [Candidatus Limnocylindrales bacterium]